jgi:hypothetical protein
MKFCAYIEGQVEAALKSEAPMQPMKRDRSSAGDGLKILKPRKSGDWFLLIFLLGACGRGSITRFS